MRLRYFSLIILMFTVPMVHAVEITQVGEYNFGVAYDIVYQDNVAYLSGNDGVDVFDVTDRRNPVKLDRIGYSNGAFGLALQGDILYIAGASDGLFIVDVSEPDEPAVLGSLQIIATDVYIEGRYAYVSSGSSYSIIDVEDPGSPEIISTVPGSGRSDHIIIVEDTLYLGDANMGLRVYDISDKTQPRLLRTVSGTAGIFDIERDESIVYLACHGNGVKVLDIFERTTPIVIGSLNNGGEAYGIHIVDDYLLVADLQQGIEILGISEPGSPMLLARWTDTHPHEISGDEQYIYLADQDHGLEIFLYGETVEEIDTGNNDSIPLNPTAILIGLIMAMITAKKGHQIQAIE